MDRNAILPLIAAVGGACSCILFSVLFGLRVGSNALAPLLALVISAGICLVGAAALVAGSRRQSSRAPDRPRLRAIAETRSPRSVSTEARSFREAIGHMTIDIGTMVVELRSSGGASHDRKSEDEHAVGELIDEAEPVSPFDREMLALHLGGRTLIDAIGVDTDDAAHAVRQHADLPQRLLDVPLYLLAVVRDGAHMRGAPIQKIRVVKKVGGRRLIATPTQEASGEVLSAGGRQRCLGRSWDRHDDRSGMTAIRKNDVPKVAWYEVGRRERCERILRPSA
jgi:hypothetical protein